jgi:hypothetical protein
MFIIYKTFKKFSLLSIHLVEERLYMLLFDFNNIAVYLVSIWAEISCSVTLISELQERCTLCSWDVCSFQN